MLDANCFNKFLKADSIFPGSVQNTSLSYGLIPLRAGRLHLFLFPVAPSVFLVITGLATLVAMMAAGLLLHLCVFHVYINIHDMTTYEYVRAQRQASEEARREALARNTEEEEEGEREEERSRCECVGRNKVAPTKKVSFEMNGWIYQLSSWRIP